MGGLDNYINDLIATSRERNAEKIFEEIVIPFLETKEQGNGGNSKTVALPKRSNGPIMYANDNSSGTSSMSNGSECVGSYQVSGYTRSDGTEVSGYTRTCGAAHLGHSKDKNGEKESKNNEDSFSNGYVLEGHVETSDIEEEAKDFAREHSKIYRNYDRLMPSEKAQKALTKIPKGDILFPLKDYYKISLELADYPEKVVSNERNSIYKAGNLPKSVDKRVVLDKISNVLKLDLNKPKDLEKAKDTVVVIPTENSKLVKVLKRSDKLKNLLKDEYKNIVNGKYEGKYFQEGVVFEKPNYGNLNTLNDNATLFGVLHNVDVHDMKQNSDGSITLVISDFYDFEHWFPKENDDVVDKRIKELNNNADRQQRADKLQPYMIYIPLHFSYEELKDILFDKENPR